MIAKMMVAATGFNICFLKGRQAAWLQVEGLPGLMTEIRECTSDLLQSLFTAMSTRARASMVMLETQVKEALIEELTQKALCPQVNPVQRYRHDMGRTARGRLWEGKGHLRGEP
jgi:hypothetical protein